MKRFNRILFASFCMYTISWIHIFFSFQSVFESGIDTYLAHDEMFFANLSLMFCVMYRFNGLGYKYRLTPKIKYLGIVFFLLATQYSHQPLRLNPQDSYLLYFIPALLFNYLVLIHPEPARMFVLSEGREYTVRSKWGNFFS